MACSYEYVVSHDIVSAAWGGTLSGGHRDPDRKGGALTEEHRRACYVTLVRFDLFSPNIRRAPHNNKKKYRYKILDTGDIFKSLITHDAKQTHFRLERDGGADGRVTLQRRTEI